MLKFERRARSNGLRSLRTLLVPVAAVIVAVVVGGLFLLVNGHQPVAVYRHMARTAFGTGYGLSDTLVAATPLILTGLAAAISFRFRLYNIGAEGQLIIGAICASGVGLTLGPNMSGGLTVILAVFAAAVGAMVWMSFAAVARAYLGTNEIVTTLLTNYVAIALMSWLIYDSYSLWRDKTSSDFPQGARMPDGVLLPRLSGTTIHWGLIMALVVALAVFAILRWTRIGFQFRVFGDSPAAAKYAGYNVRLMIIIILCASAAVAGLAGASEVLGRSHRLDPGGLAIGLGYSGIVVAALARYRPLTVVPMAIFIGGISIGGDSLQYFPSGPISSAISPVIQGIVLVCLLCSQVFLTYRLRWVSRGRDRYEGSVGSDEVGRSDVDPAAVGAQGHE